MGASFHNNVAFHPAMQLTFQAIENVNRGHISTEDKLYQLKALQEADKKEEVYTLHHTILAMFHLQQY